MKFKIGDRVRYINYYRVSGPYSGSTGVIADYDEYWAPPWGVCFDDDFWGAHNLGGKISTRTGWWCNEDELELIEPEEDFSINADLEEVL